MKLFKEIYRYIDNKKFRVLLMALLICLPLIGSARPGDKPANRPDVDKRPYRLGFSVGMNMLDLLFTHNGFVTPEGGEWRAEVPSSDPGFCVSVMGEMRLSRYLSLRLSPGMYFGSKSIEMLEANSGGKKRQDEKNAYVTLPLDLKVAGDRMRNIRPYVTGGMMAAFDVTRHRRETLQFNSSDLYLTVGMGIDLYFPYFKLDPEIKFCFGMTDILRHKRPDLADDPLTYGMTQSLSKVKSNMVVLTFYFE